MIEAVVLGQPVRLATDPAVFSPKAVDRGTLAMLSQVTFLPSDRVLDIGCGSGVVGIVAAKQIGSKQVWMTDSDPRAVEVAGESAALNNLPDLRIQVSDAFDQITEKDFSLVLCNPPYHEDFSVASRIIGGAFSHLKIGGYLYMVTKRHDWYRNKIRTVFGGVNVAEVDGYFVFKAQKREEHRRKPQKKEAQLSKKLARKEALKKRHK